MSARTGAACCRKKNRASKTCATGYVLDCFNAVCLTECPLKYLIQCDMQLNGIVVKAAALLNDIEV